jgi:hypothetical protein
MYFVIYSGPFFVMPLFNRISVTWERWGAPKSFLDVNAICVVVLTIYFGTDIPRKYLNRLLFPADVAEEYEKRRSKIHFFKQKELY